MKVFILSTDTGQGHNSAAKAVNEYLDTQETDVLIKDVLNTGRERSAVISKLYDGMINHMPGFFGMLYSLAERIVSARDTLQFIISIPYTLRHLAG